MNQHRLHPRRQDRRRVNDNYAARRVVPHRACVFATLVGMMLATSCAPTKPRAKPASQPSLSSATDPCALRLHDLLGGLLLYYAQHNDLPPNLKSLPLPSGETSEATHCPVSNEPYIYDPAGVPAPDGQSLLVIYDAVPAHAGFRWAVSIAQPRPGKPLTGEVLAVPESAFAVRRH